MTVEEYLGHMCDRLMLQFSNRSEMPEMNDWVVMEVIAAAVEDLKQDYVLTHKSHLEVHQLYDQASASYLTNGMLHVMCSDRIHDTELLQYRFRCEVLESKVPKVFDKMVKYLEAPKPEQTQPAQS